MIDKAKTAKITAVVLFVYELGTRIADRVRARRAQRARRKAQRTMQEIRDSEAGRDD